MELFGRSQSVDSADRDQSTRSGSISVFSRDQSTELLRKKIPLEQPAAPFSGESRYLTQLWVSGNEEPWEDHHQSDTSKSITTGFERKTVNIVPRHQMTSKKIRDALKLLVFREQQVLVQFWSPHDVGKHQLLTTLDQPFGLGVATEELCLYRRGSERNVFFVDRDHKEGISPPARVFRRELPEWTSDLGNYLPEHFSQQDLAIRCHLHGYLALPVFDSITRSCVGVLELLASSKYKSFAYEVKKIHMALKIQNLECPQVFDSATPNVTDERRQNELDKILGILNTVCDIHCLPLAQTWAVSPSTSFVSHEKVIKNSCSSFDTKCTGKVCISTNSLPFHVRDLSMWHFRESSKEQHLDMSGTFVGRALLGHGSSYCEDINQLCEEEYPLVHNARMSGLSSCFAIFLHSVEVDDDYVLEFFLPSDSKDSRNVLKLVQTLKQKVEVISGFELGTMSSTELIGLSRDSSYLSLSIKPQTIQISSITTANTLAFGLDSSDSESFFANFVKNHSEIVPSQCSSKENDRNDNITNTVNSSGSRKNDNATSFPILSGQKTNAGEKSNSLKRGRKRKIDSITIEAVEQHVGKPIGQAAESFGVSRSTLKRFCRENGITSWPKPNQSKKTSCVANPKLSNELRSSSPWFATRLVVFFVVKLKWWSCLRKLHGLSNDQHSYLPSKTDSVNQEAQLMVKATFKDDMIKFRFPISSGLLELENRVAQRLNLLGKRLCIKYKDEDNDMLSITCDDDLHALPEFFASEKTIKFRVELSCE